MPFSRSDDELEEDPLVLVLIVSLTVHGDAVDEFRSAIAANAAASVRDEPGCTRFDVVELDGEEHRFAVRDLRRCRSLRGTQADGALRYVAGGWPARS